MVLRSFQSDRLRLYTLLLLFLAFPLSAQVSLTGTVVDDTTGETLIGASIAIGGTGTVSDIDGNFSIELKPQTYSLTISYVGYEAYSAEIDLATDKRLDVRLKSSQFLKEIVVTADIARARETPVAFSNITTLKLQEELAAQDIPMVLNSTPGAYATQSGGGDGDARITIRGFNQRNVAVMLNGIPVNDMENGWVYWSNWFGLDLVTKTMQVQRGLGASKLATPSVGGTINILTKGIDSKRSLRVKQEIGNNGFSRSTVGYTSGRLSNGWGFSFAGSYKRGNGWVDGTFTEGFFYYARIDKEIGKHTISFTGFGAPQKHGQRPFKTHVSEWDSEIALDLNVPEEIANRPSETNLGLRYNSHLGKLDGELYNTRQNYYHKPQLSLRHSWSPSERFFLSNVAYLSIGNGGGTRIDGGSAGNDEDGFIDLDRLVELNQTTSQLKPDTRSTRIIGTNVNNHFWYGLLSTLKYDLSSDLSLSGGMDLRNYRGDHFSEVYDLLGGSYFRSTGNLIIDQKETRLQVGDKYNYNNSGFVRWAGLFGLLEYKKPSYSVFLNLSASSTGYKLEDYYKPLKVELADTSFFVYHDNDVDYQGINYNVDSPEAKAQSVGWIDILGYTAKVGANYKLTERVNAFVNLGYLNRPQRFSNVINENSFSPLLPIAEFNTYDNEEVRAIELGSSFKSSLVSVNLNAYRTEWQNKPLDRSISVPNPQNPTDRIPVNVSGIDALHMGIELDAAFQITSNLKLETLFSIGDWKWNSEATVTLPDGSFFDFDARDVPVGDAAQFQAGATLRYEPFKGLYLKPKWSFFDKNYANFNPTDLTSEFAAIGERIPWQLPAYSIFDLHMGYGFKITKRYAKIRFNILNLLDAKYISDAQNNDRFNDFNTNDSDANSAAVFFGQGRRWTTSFEMNF